MPRKQQILLEQRRALRAWAHQQHPRPSQKECIEWFQQQYNRKIGQSTVSESLSTHFNDLDSTKAGVNRARLRLGQWPDLEKILIFWQHHIESKGGVTSGELLRQRAQQIWQQLPQYSNQPCPEFSNGWLQKFKKRHNIKEHTQHGEAGSVPSTAEADMKTLQTFAGEFQEEDIYNMDETGLFWKMTPSRGLATSTQPGVKKEKARVTLVFCTNATGSDRINVWIIGKAKSPRALKNINVETMGGQWRWDKNAWMNTTIMVEWLQAFYLHIGETRKVLLTMDNFSAHYAAFEMAPPPSNIHICWLPANSTSRFQPLDQGIIQSFKANYRRQWLSYMLGCFERDEDPLKLINIHLAIRWILRSWNHFLSNTTIYNCFRKSTLLVSPLSLITPLNPTNIGNLYDEVVKTGNIHDVMAISNFLNPEEEVEIGDTSELNSDDVLQDLIAQHIGLPQNQDDDEDNGQPDEPVYTIQEARRAAQVLIKFAEGSGDLKTAQLRAIERVEFDLEVLESRRRVQGTLDS